MYTRRAREREREGNPVGPYVPVRNYRCLSDSLYSFVCTVQLSRLRGIASANVLLIWLLDDNSHLAAKAIMVDSGKELQILRPSGYQRS